MIGLHVTEQHNLKKFIDSCAVLKKCINGTIFVRRIFECAQPNQTFPMKFVNMSFDVVAVW